MAKNLNPQNIANKWSQNLGSATQAYTDGVNSVSVSPGQAANNNVQGYLSGVQAAVASGAYQAGNNSYTLQQWQSTTVQKGASRLASGASAAKSKMQTFFSSYIPQLQNIVGQLPPRGTFEQNQQRSIQMQNALHQLKGTLKSK